MNAQPARSYEPALQPDPFNHAEPYALTIELAAAKVNLSARTIRRAIKSGKLPAYHCGARVLIDPADLCAWVFAEPIKPAPRPPARPSTPPLRLAEVTAKTKPPNVRGKRKAPAEGPGKGPYPKSRTQPRRGSLQP